MASRERKSDNLGRFSHQLQINTSVTRTMSFILNPYHRYINSSTSERLKLFLKKKRKGNKTINSRSPNHTGKPSWIHSQATPKTFGWGTLLNVVPTTIGGDSKFFLTNFTEVKLEYVKKQARTT